MWRVSPENASPPHHHGTPHKEKQIIVSSQRQPQETPADKQGGESTTAATISSKGADTQGRKNEQHRACHAANFICSLRPTTAQELWNFLLVIFTGILAVVAWNQYASDAAYLIIGPINFERPTGFISLPVENDGRRASGDVAVTVSYAYSDRTGKFWENAVYRMKFLMPGIPAGKTPYFLAFTFEKWDTARLERIIKGDENARIGITLNYRDYGIRQAKRRFCQQTISIKNGSDMTWGPCDLSFVDRMEAASAQSQQQPAAAQTTAP